MKFRRTPGYWRAISNKLVFETEKAKFRRIVRTSVIIRVLEMPLIQELFTLVCRSERFHMNCLVIPHALSAPNVPLKIIEVVPSLLEIPSSGYPLHKK